MALEFRLPDVGEGIDAGEVLAWHVAVGDRVREDEPLCDVQTDKAIVTLPSPATGTVLELCAEPGDLVPVGVVLIRIDVDAGARAEPDTVDNGAGGRPLAAPATRQLARELGVALAEVAGSGPGGRITREDVEAAHAALQAPEPAATTRGSARDEVVPLAGLRRAIAEKLTLAWQTIPHVTDYREVDATALMAARRALRDRAERSGDAALAKALTLTPLVMKACVAALRHHRYVNASIDLERKQIVLHGSINVGVATATPDGLIVPVVHDVDGKTLAELAIEVAQLAAAARDRTIAPAQLAGATFTVNNYGTLGTWLGTPIIPPPQVANFGMGRIDKQAVVRNGEIVARPILPLAVSGDHRVLDGHTLAAFVSEVADYLQEPALLLAESR